MWKISFENKLTVIALLIAVASLVVGACSVYITNKNQNKQYTQSRAKEAVIDLNKILISLPIDSRLQECLEVSRSSIPYGEERLSDGIKKYDRCLSSLRSELSSFDGLLLKHDDLFREISETHPRIAIILRGLYFQVQEIQNNQRQLEIWFLVGCPDEVQHIERYGASELDQDCLLVMEASDDYKERIENTRAGNIEQKSATPYGLTGWTKREDIRMRSIIIPASIEVSPGALVLNKTTMTDHLYEMNRSSSIIVQKQVSLLKGVVLKYAEIIN